jgi:hypothetical protein
MVNSKGFITMLDGISGLVGFVDKLAASMGGASGVLTSFFGIAMKIFSPKISQGLRDTAYTVSMMFGGEEKMRSARNKILDSALTKIDTNGEFGDLYGQQEAAARRAAM